MFLFLSLSLLLSKKISKEKSEKQGHMTLVSSSSIHLNHTINILQFSETLHSLVSWNVYSAVFLEVKNFKSIQKL